MLQSIKMEQWQEDFGGELLVKRRMAQVLCGCFKPAVPTKYNRQLTVGIYKEIEDHQI
jgi:hypothetical protein